MTTNFKWDLGVRLTHQVKAGDVEAVGETTTEIFNNIVASGSGKLDEVKLRIHRALGMATRAAYDAGAAPRQLIAARDRTLESILKARSVKRLMTVAVNEARHIATLVGAERDAVADRLPKAVAYVKKHAVEGVTRADIAKLMDCSQGHVSRLFSDVLGKHFKEFVLECRIDQAKKLLLSGDDKIIDVAFYSGFEDPNYFGTCFKRITGVTPGQYRRSRGE